MDPTQDPLQPDTPPEADKSAPTSAAQSAISDQTPPESSPAQQPQKRSEGWRSALATITVLLVAPLIAIFLIAFVFQSYEVSGPSMQTTLNNNDRLIVWKLARTWSRITGHDYIPKRGDVIVFVSHDATDDQKQLIKRVVALPAEKVAVKDGHLIVYNKDHPQGFQPDTSLPYGKVITETLPETEQTEWTVGPHEVFVCGDNRPNSRDSRSFGPVAAKDIVGKLIMRVLPLNQAKRF